MNGLGCKLPWKLPLVPPWTNLTPSQPPLPPFACPARTLSRIRRSTPSHIAGPARGFLHPSLPQPHRPGVLAQCHARFKICRSRRDCSGPVFLCLSFFWAYSYYCLPSSARVVRHLGSESLGAMASDVDTSWPRSASVRRGSDKVAAARYGPLECRVLPLPEQTEGRRCCCSRWRVSSARQWLALFWDFLAGASPAGRFHCLARCRPRRQQPVVLGHACWPGQRRSICLNDVLLRRLFTDFSRRWDPPRATPKGSFPSGRASGEGMHSLPAMDGRAFINAVCMPSIPVKTIIFRRDAYACAVLLPVAKQLRFPGSRRPCLDRVLAAQRSLAL